MEPIETYISIDVETAGPVPGLYHMLELGAVAVNVPRDRYVTEFSESLQLVPGNYPLQFPNFKNGWDLSTWDFWNSNDAQKKKLAEMQESAIPAQEAMTRFSEWIHQFKKPVLVGWPIAFDAMFVTWYWWKHLKTDPPFSHHGIDIKTLAMRALGGKGGYKDASKKNLKKKFPFLFMETFPHTHRGLDDAREQGWLFESLIKIAGLGHILEPEKIREED